MLSTDENIALTVQDMHDTSKRRLSGPLVLDLEPVSADQIEAKKRD
jgi:hypothetical protein